MVVTLVMDQYGDSSNGTTVTAMRFAEVLKQKGHTVKVLTASEVTEEGVFVLPEWKMPVFHSLVKKQGMKFAQPDENIIRQALEGSDVVHLLMPFMVQNAALKIALDMNIAITAGFHVQPENFTYSIGFGKVGIVNKGLYAFFKSTFYKKINYIHCPSQMMKDLLIKHKYSGNIYAISNGVSDSFSKVKTEKPDDLKDKYVIIMVGRYSKEKRQDLIIKAIGESKYNDKIQLILAGKGPTKNKLEKLSDKYLANKVKFTFLPKDELIDLINYCDLYVHSSDAESEAISCLEAITCGLVPIISDSEICATKQFALCEQNLFSKGDYEDLKNKIEWMIEHPEEKEKLSERYIEYAKNFTLEACVDKLIDVFKLAIEENEIKIENNKLEKQYLSNLTEKEVKQFEKSKKLYTKNCIKDKKRDFINSYITTLQK